MRDMLAQARAAKCSALIFTLDMPVPVIAIIAQDLLANPFFQAIYAVSLNQSLDPIGLGMSAYAADRINSAILPQC